MKKQILLFVLALLPLVASTMPLTPLVLPKTYTYNAGAMTAYETWGDGTIQAQSFVFKLNLSQMEYQIHNDLGLSLYEFEQHFTPDVAGGLFQQYYIAANGYAQVVSGPSNNENLGSIKLKIAIGDEESSVIEWDVTASQLKQYITDCGANIPNTVTRLVKFTSDGYNGLPDVYVALVASPLTVAAAQAPTGVINWNGLKNPNYWYAKDSHVDRSGFAEIHANVFGVEDEKEAQAYTLKQNVRATFLSNKICDLTSLAAIKNFITFTNLPDDATANNLNFALNFVLGENTEFKGYLDGIEKTFVCVLRDDNRELKVYRKDDPLKAEQSVAKLLYADATDSLNIVDVQYQHTDYAEALLNYKRHNALNDNVLTAYLNVKARYKEYPFTVFGDPINVRFLRPINVESNNLQVENTSVNSKRIIYLRNLVNLTDWRLVPGTNDYHPFKTNYWFYYNIKSIEILGVSNGGNLDENNAILTNINQAVGSNPVTALSAVSNLVEFKYYKATPTLTPNASPGQADYGRIEYTCLSSAVKDFKVRIPIKVSYEWGNIFTTVDFEIINQQQDNIIFADANVKALCVANWDTNGDGELSKNEAAAVTSLGNVFNNNSSITSFDELQYFVGLAPNIQNNFSGCSNLTSIIIPNSVTSLEATFSDCSSLTTITIPNSVTSIGGGVFHGCTGLISITIPNSVTYIGTSAFADCSNLSSITIPNSVTSLGFGVFSGCTSLTSVAIPSSVTSLNGTFSGCSSLTSVTIPNSVTTIDRYAFAGCSGLTSITIPNSVTNIGEYAFDRCDNLLTVNSQILEPFNCPNAFSTNTQRKGTLIVPVGTKDLYTRFDGWREFLKIEEAGKTYQLSFVVNNSLLSTQDTEAGAIITPPITDGEGKSISWYTYPETMPAYNLVIYGMMAQPAAPTKYTITYVLDGQTYRSVTVDEGATISKEKAPYKEGYTFNGWQNEPTTMPGRNVTVSGSFSVNSYRLSFIVDNQELSTRTMTYGATITTPTNDNEGNTITWYTHPTTMPAHDLVVYGMVVKEPEPEVFAWLTVNDSRSGYTKIKVKQGAEQTLNFTAEEGWKISNIFMDGRYVTSRLAEDGTFVTPVITGDTSIIIVYEEEAPSDARAATRSQADIKVVSDGVVISNAEPQSRCIIYGSDGQQVVNTVINDGTRKIALQQGQVYILTINGRTLKFAL